MVSQWRAADVSDMPDTDHGHEPTHKAFPLLDQAAHVRSELDDRPLFIMLARDDEVAKADG